MSKLVTYKLGDICNVTDYVANGSFAALNENVEYLDTKNYAVMIRLVDYKSNWKSSLLYTTKKSYEFLKKSSLNPGDVVIANVGANAGTIFRVPNLGMPMTLAPNAVACFPKELNILDRDFLYYYFLSSNGQWSISTILGGSAQPKFNKTDFRSLELSVPAIDDQKAISHILGTLDKKIELNKKTNKSLEDIAKGLFKSWFIDFDPVRAKAEGRSTGLPDEISDLFPDSFEDSELGEIPYTWRIYSLKELSSYLSRGISPKYCEQGEGVRVVNQKCIRDGMIDFSKARNHDPLLKKIEGREIQKFDCLINSTGVGTLGRVAVTPDIEEKSVIVDSHVTVVRGKNIEQSLFLTMLLLQRQGEIESLGEGSTGQTELSRKILGDLEIIFPSEKLINQFFISSLSLFKRKWLNEKITLKLCELKDTLLPKLISGELRIPDAEKIILEAGI